MLNIIVCNDFSLHMLIENCSIKFEKISFQKFQNILTEYEYETCIGDKYIANVLGLDFNKNNISLDKNTRLIVAKLVGKEHPSDSDSIDSEFEFYDIKYDKRCC